MQCPARINMEPGTLERIYFLRVWRRVHKDLESAKSILLATGASQQT